jgi:hypothetical protein
VGARKSRMRAHNGLFRPDSIQTTSWIYRYRYTAEAGHSVLQPGLFLLYCILCDIVSFLH